MGIRPFLAVASVALASVALIGGVGVNRVLAETTTLDGLSASATVDSTPASFWFGQVNRDGICRMISGCVSASGVDPDWVFAVNVDVVGAGTQRVDVKVHVGPQVMAQRATYALAFNSPVGSLTGNVNLALTPRGPATLVTLTLDSMVATGFAQDSLTQFAQTLTPVLTSQLAVLSRERVDAGTKVTLKVVPGRKALARVTVMASSLNKKAPTAKGVVRILVGTKVVCSGKVRKSIGTCFFVPPKRGTVVRAVVTGQLSNGYPVWNSGTARYAR